ncbi:Protein FAM186A [Nymphon striatum]|nr:Protein FAM186A [Nymphon striatum]
MYTSMKNRTAPQILTIPVIGISGIAAFFHLVIACIISVGFALTCKRFVDLYEKYDFSSSCQAILYDIIYDLKIHGSKCLLLVETLRDNIMGFGSSLGTYLRCICCKTMFKALNGTVKQKIHVQVDENTINFLNLTTTTQNAIVTTAPVLPTTTAQVRNSSQTAVQMKEYTYITPIPRIPLHLKAYSGPEKCIAGEAIFHFIDVPTTTTSPPTSQGQTSAEPSNTSNSYSQVSLSTTGPTTNSGQSESETSNFPSQTIHLPSSLEPQLPVVTTIDPVLQFISSSLPSSSSIAGEGGTTPNLEQARRCWDILIEKSSCDVFKSRCPSIFNVDPVDGIEDIAKLAKDHAENSNYSISGFWFNGEESCQSTKQGESHLSGLCHRDCAEDDPVFEIKEPQPDTTLSYCLKLTFYPIACSKLSSECNMQATLDELKDFEDILVPIIGNKYILFEKGDGFCMYYKGGTLVTVGCKDISIYRLATHPFFCKVDCPTESNPAAKNLEVYISDSYNYLFVEKRGNQLWFCVAGDFERILYVSELMSVQLMVEELRTASNKVDKKYFCINMVESPVTCTEFTTAKGNLDMDLITIKEAELIEQMDLHGIEVKCPPKAKEGDIIFNSMLEDSCYLSTSIPVSTTPNLGSTAQSQPVTTIVSTTPNLGSTAQSQPVTTIVSTTPNFGSTAQSQPVTTIVSTTPNFGSTAQSQPITTTVSTTPNLGSTAQSQPVTTIVSTTPNLGSTAQSQPVTTIVSTTANFESTAQSQPVKTIVSTTPNLGSTVQSQPVTTTVSTTPNLGSTVQSQPVTTTVLTTPNLGSTTQPQLVTTAASTTPNLRSTTQSQPITTTVSTTPNLGSTTQPQPATTTVSTTPNLGPITLPQPVTTTVSTTPNLGPTIQSQPITTTVSTTPNLGSTTKPQPAITTVSTTPNLGPTTQSQSITTTVSTTPNLGSKNQPQPATTTASTTPNLGSKTQLQPVTTTVSTPPNLVSRTQSHPTTTISTTSKVGSTAQLQPVTATISTTPHLESTVQSQLLTTTILTTSNLGSTILTTPKSTWTLSTTTAAPHVVSTLTTLVKPIEPGVDERTVNVHDPTKIYIEQSKTTFIPKTTVDESSTIPNLAGVTSPVIPTTHGTTKEGIRYSSTSVPQTILMSKMSEKSTVDYPVHTNGATSDFHVTSKIIENTASADEITTELTGNEGNMKKSTEIKAISTTSAKTNAVPNPTKPLEETTTIKSAYTTNYKSGSIEPSHEWSTQDKLSIGASTATRKKTKGNKQDKITSQISLSDAKTSSTTSDNNGVITTTLTTQETTTESSTSESSTSSATTEAKGHGGNGGDTGNIGNNGDGTSNESNRDEGTTSLPDKIEISLSAKNTVSKSSLASSTAKTVHSVTTSTKSGSESATRSYPVDQKKKSTTAVPTASTTTSTEQATTTELTTKKHKCPLPGTCHGHGNGEENETVGKVTKDLKTTKLHGKGNLSKCTIIYSFFFYLFVCENE